jgi:hypothetical protein
MCRNVMRRFASASPERAAARPSETVRTWLATTNQIVLLQEHLIAEQVSLVVMEATSDYVRHEGA